MYICISRKLFIMRLSLQFFSFLILFEIIQDGDTVCGGRKAKYGQFKYIACIDMQNNICSGAIIDEIHILTAAHCVDSVRPSDISITVGTINIHDGSGKHHSVRRIHIHPYYKRAYPIQEDRKGVMRLLQCVLGPNYQMIMPENDIAVITLNRPLALEGYVDKVELPPTDDLPLCTPCEFAGWGVSQRHGEQSPILQWNTIGIVPPEIYTQMPDYDPDKFLAIDDNLCTSPLQGDSGGPLVCNGIAVGIISSGKSSPRTPTTFIKIYNFITFINLVRSKDYVLK